MGKAGNRPLISVVVPVYMIERYLGVCIESILNQTYCNLEIILVDDGSKDRCPEICDLYARKDSRVKVIHKRNGGLVLARKAGLGAAAGDYVGYVDGDDWIEPRFYEMLLRAMEDSGSDMVCAGWSRDLFAKTEHFCNSFPVGIYEGETLEGLHRAMISHSSFFRPGISTYVWNKLFKKEILYSPQMSVDDRISIGEDAAVTYPALLNCKRVCVTNHAAYHYRQREDSMLKQSGLASEDSRKLKCLYRCMMEWSKVAEERSGKKGLFLAEQVKDFVLSICMVRFGGRLEQGGGHPLYSVFDGVYLGKKVVVYSAGTFGQQLVKSLKKSRLCEVVLWVDDDYWEYRRCCMDVDPVESVADYSFDYVLAATVDDRVAEDITERLTGLGVQRSKILTVNEPDEKEGLLERFFDAELLETREREEVSHA